MLLCNVVAEKYRLFEEWESFTGKETVVCASHGIMLRIESKHVFPKVVKKYDRMIKKMAVI